MPHVDWQSRSERFFGTLFAGKTKAVFALHSWRTKVEVFLTKVFLTKVEVKSGFRIAELPRNSH